MDGSFESSRREDFDKARACLSLDVELSSLPCRETEIAEITDFVQVSTYEMSKSVRMPFKLVVLVIFYVSDLIKLFMFRCVWHAWNWKNSVNSPCLQKIERRSIKRQNG